MKNLVVFIAFIFFILTASAQQHKSYIEVTGSVQYQRTVEKYTAKMVISPAISYDISDDFITLKENFFIRFKKAGMDRNRLHENKFRYSILGYRKKGTMYVYETSSKEDFITFLNINAIGTMINDKNIFYKVNEDMSTVSKKAIKNAKEKATIIAASAHKKIGGIIAIIDCNEVDPKQTLYDVNEDFIQNYEIEVRFEILN